MQRGSASRSAAITNTRLAHSVLLPLTVTLAIASLWIGATWIRPDALFQEPARTIIFELRLPRILAAILIGAGLGASGMVLQATLRNPLADPALLGVSGGAALAAAATLVLIGSAPVWIQAFTLPIAAFVGAVAAAILVWRIGRAEAGFDLSAVLLAGMAVNLLTGALVAMLLIIADDAALRSTTYWLFGSLNRIHWPHLAALAIAIPTLVWWLERRALDLDTYQLGDEEARHAGVDTPRLQRQALFAACSLTALCVAFAGILGFIGLLVPHLVRLLGGTGHAGAHVASAMTGACLLLIADAGSRTLLAPAEVPLGVLTAAIGSPLFLWLLARTLPGNEST